MASIFCAAPCSDPSEAATKEPATEPLETKPSGIKETYSEAQSTDEPAPTPETVDGELEIDYDAGSTGLYRCIESKNWDNALTRLESHPDEAKTWVYRKEYKSESLRWKLLPLHSTCIFRAPLALIEALVDAYPEAAEKKDDQGMLPIHLACRNGASKAVVLTLLNAFPKSYSEKDRKGRNPLDLVEASSSQNLAAVATAIREFVKERGFKSIDVQVSDDVPDNEVDYDNRTTLFKLIMKKDWKAVSERAKSNPEEAVTWIATKGYNGNLRFLPLHKACVLQPPEHVIEALIKAYPDAIKSRDQDGWLPIHCACFYGAAALIVKLLLDAYGKCAQLKDDEGRLPLHYACLKGASQDVVEELLKTFSKAAMSKDDEGRLPIHHACSKGAPEGVIDALLKASPKGAQTKDEHGRLPLHHACRKSSSERVVRTLLRVYPRAAQIKDDQDKLPIHYACQHEGTPSVINVLLTTYPESINVKNGFGYTPLAEARAVDDSKMEPIIHVLEKFKVEQDKIKIDSGENAIIEAKIDTLAKRVTHLETMLANAKELGSEIKSSAKKTKDPYTLIDQMANRLANLDISSNKPVKKGLFGRKKVVS